MLLSIWLWMQCSLLIVLRVLWSTVLCSQRTLQKRLGDNGLFSQGSLTQIFIIEGTNILYVALYVQLAKLGH